MSKQPSWEHQFVCLQLVALLHQWSTHTGHGVANIAPGLIFAPDNDVAPDVVWISTERLPSVLQPDGKLHGAPDLTIEVLSPGPQNVQRDRVTKLGLSSRRGVPEYWIVDWQWQQVEIYRSVEVTLCSVAIALSPYSVRARCWNGRFYLASPARYGSCSADLHRGEHRDLYRSGRAGAQAPRLYDRVPRACPG